MILIGSVFISSYITAVNFSESCWGLVYLVGWFGISLIFLFYANQEITKKLLIITSLVGGVLSFISLLQGYDLFNIPSISSPSATFGNRNFWGMYLCFAVPATIFSSIIVRSSHYRLIHLFMFLLSMVSLLNTRSRAAWLGVFFGILLIILLFRIQIIAWIKQSYKKKYAIFITVLLISMAFALIFIAKPETRMPVYKKTIWSTLMTVKDIGSEDVWAKRISQYKATSKMIKGNWLLGVGFENWRIHYPKYSGHLINDKNYLLIRQRPHNDLFWTVAEVGAIGFFLFAIVIGLPLLRSVKNLWITRKNNITDERLINGFIVISIVAILVESLFDFPRQRTVPNMYLWGFMGYLVSHFKGSTFIKDYIAKLFPYVIFISFSIVSFMGYRDYHSNIHSQDLRYLKDNQKYRLAVKSAAKALGYGRNVDNTGTPIYFYLGISEFQMGNIKSAQNYFRKSLEISPYHLGALENYMITLGKLNILTKSLEIMYFCRTLYPNYYNVMLNMSKLYLRANHYSEAKDILLDIKNDISARGEKISWKVKKETRKLIYYIQKYGDI
ncbi:MAG: O-antigen ligase family protein [Candidatus Cloacimonetes bacterium]|nr:O-antigen ligase family protein [Candidatus Cloacimonadota bacterium]